MDIYPFNPKAEIICEQEKIPDEHIEGWKGRSAVQVGLARGGRGVLRWVA